MDDSGFSHNGFSGGLPSSCVSRTQTAGYAFFGQDEGRGDLLLHLGKKRKSERVNLSIRVAARTVR